MNTIGKIGIGIGSFVAGTAALLGAAAVGARHLGPGGNDRRRSDGAEHVPSDLMGDTHPGPNDRAPDAFRPDPTAPVPDSEREGLRPATGPAPTMVQGHSADRI